MYIKKATPSCLSRGADPELLEKILKEEDEDLVTPVQQKLLKRILSGVTPKKQEPLTIKKRPAPPKPPRSKKQNTTGPFIPWSELPFFEGGDTPDLESVIGRTSRRLRK